MINPGIENNPVYPTSSGQGGSPRPANLWGKQIVAIDGFSITMGIVVVMILAYIVWASTLGKRRR